MQRFEMNSKKPRRASQSAARFMWGGHSCPPLLTLFFVQRDKNGCPIFRVFCERWDSTNLNAPRWQKPMSHKSVQAVNFLLTLLLFVSFVPQSPAQTADSAQTMRPVIRGRHAAVASMKAEATEVARQILDSGGNAFEAAVGGADPADASDFAFTA